MGKLLLRGVLSPLELVKLIDASRGKGVVRILRYIEKARVIKGARSVNADLVKGQNWFKGAEWVLRWIDAKRLWKQVRAFEKVGTNRFWDAHIGKKLYQFKSWLKFHPCNWCPISAWKASRALRGLLMA